MQEWNATKACEEIEQKKEYLKLEQGVHQVLFKDKGVLVDREFKKEDGTIEKRKQVQFAVMCKGKASLFAVNVSPGSSSLYAQLAIIGDKYGSLQDKTLTILVHGTGKDKRYTIPEAVEQLQIKKVGEELVK